MRRTTMTLAALAALPIGAQASGADYSYVQADYVDSGEARVDGVTGEYDGYGLRISAATGPASFLVMDGEIVETDDLESNGTKIADSETELERYSLGFGGHVGDGETVDLYGVASVDRLEIGGLTGTGFGLGGGLRLTFGSVTADAANKVEINPHVKYVRYGDIGAVNLGGTRYDMKDVDGFEYGIAVLFHLAENVALSVDYGETSLNVDVGGSAPDPELDLEDQLAFGLRVHY